MVNPLTMQHILSNSSIAEKIQQTNYTTADGQQKLVKFQKEKRGEEQKTKAMEKSDQVIIREEHQSSKQQDLFKSKTKKKSVKESLPLEEEASTQGEEAPKIDILI